MLLRADAAGHKDAAQERSGKCWNGCAHQPGLKRLVTVLMSNSEDQGDINRAYDLGCNSYVQKPMAFGELVERVRLVNRYWLLVNSSPICSTGRTRMDDETNESRVCRSRLRSYARDTSGEKCFTPRHLK